MAAQRPSFSRFDTDQIGIPLADMKRKEHPEDVKGAGGGVYEVSEAPPAFDAEAANHFGETIVVKNAEDLVGHLPSCSCAVLMGSFSR